MRLAESLQRRANPNQNVRLNIVVSRVVVPDDNCELLEDGEIAIIHGRTLKPWWLKIFPVWWFLNDDEQRVEDAPWYQPTWPEWARWIMWNIRNPLQNLRAYVIGVSDRNYTVIGRKPVTTVQRDDLYPPEYGWQWSVIHLSIRRPFVSYSGKYFVWYAGWQPSGFFGLKFNLHASRLFP